MEKTAVVYNATEQRIDSKHDCIRPWFQASKDLGDHIGIRFGHLVGGNDNPEWIYRSHADYDGIGGFADILRKRGVSISSLPSISHKREPSWGPFFKSLPEYIQKRHLVTLKNDFSSACPSCSENPPNSVAWHVFDEESTSRIKNYCHVQGYTVNSFLLKNLSQAVYPSLAEDSKPLSWMIPVNLRGKVQRARDTENHASYVRVVVKKNDSTAEIHKKIYKALAEGVHWANWKAYSSLSFLPMRQKRFIIKIGRVTSQSLFGAFSNLGEWDNDSHFLGEKIDGDWLFTPPAMCFFKVSCGCITYRGRLSLCMHLHSEISTDPSDAKAWMDGWRKLIVDEISLEKGNVNE